MLHLVLTAVMTAVMSHLVLTAVMTAVMSHLVLFTMMILAMQVVATTLLAHLMFILREEIEQLIPMIDLSVVDQQSSSMSLRLSTV